MKTKFMIAMAIGMLLTWVTPSVAGERLSKETMEKVTEIRSHLKEKRQNVKMRKDVVDMSFDSGTAPQRQKVTETDEPMVTINCKFVWDEDEMWDMRPNVVAIQSIDGEYYNTAYPNFLNSHVTIKAPIGKECYLIGIFDDSHGPVIIVKTINASEELELEINAEEANQKIRFKPILPNGEKLTVDAYSYDDGKLNLCDEGTVNQAWIDMNVQLKNGSILSRFFREYERFLLEDGYFDSVDDIYFATNDNECICLYSSICAFSKKYGAITIKLVANGNHSQEVTNLQENYIDIERNYASSIWQAPNINEYYPEIDPSKNCGFGISTNWILSNSNGQFLVSFAGKDIYPTDKIYLNAPSPNGSDYLELIANPVKIIYSNINEYNYTTRFGISSPSIMVINGLPMNIATNNYILEQNYMGISKFLNSNSENFGYVYNPWFSYPVSKESIEVFGNNVPITQFVTDLESKISYNFIGRYSESRSIDFMNHKVLLYHDNDLIANSWQEIQELPFYFMIESVEPGTFKLEIENDNMIIDNIQGHSMFITEYDNRIGNSTFPALGILQFRNLDDEVTDRFGKAEDGILSFAAGALRYTTVNNYNCFEYEPLEQVKVEYAPNGTDFYKELLVEEDPDKFYMPGYGAYYYATLDQVEGKSENGWFDVRITLVASNGNYQQQTISPAFKIDNSVGIPTIEEGNSEAVVRVVGNNIIAPADAKIINASGIATDGKNVVPGIYIISFSDGKTQKIMVK